MKKFRHILLILTAILVVAMPLGASAAPKLMSDGTVFDAAYYAAHNPDVVKVYGKKDSDLYAHYTKHGRSEGRVPAEPADQFDAAYYVSQYPDLRAAFGLDSKKLYQHFLLYGKAEHRRAVPVPSSAAAPTPASSAVAPIIIGFDPQYYATAHPDAVREVGTDSVALYNHYIRVGKAKGYLPLRPASTASYSSSSSASASSGSSSAGSASSARFATDVMNIVNLQRSGEGLPLLSWDADLAAAAGTRVAELGSSFSHTRPNNTSCFTTVPDGLFSKLGENIAQGYNKPEDVMSAWMGSAGHAANILGAGYTKIGVAYSNGYWVQMFGG